MTDNHLLATQRQPPIPLAAPAKLEDNRKMTDLSFSFPPAMLSWLEQRVAQGDYVDVGDYLRDLVRRDRAETEDVARVRALIEEGEASGYIDADPATLIEEIIAERRARRG